MRHISGRPGHIERSRYQGAAVAVIGNISRNRQGATAIEYALIAALVAMAIVAVVGVFGIDLTDVFTSVAGSL